MVKRKEDTEPHLSSAKHDHLNNMDAGNPSTSIKPTNVSVRGSDAAPLEEVFTGRRTSGQWDPGRDADGERQLVSEKEAESVVDGVIPTAVTSINHKGAADKQRFNTLGYQKKQKHGVVPEFATVSKAVSGNIKPRGTLRQALFSQAPSEKAPTPEERAQLEALKHTLESFPLPVLPDWKGQGGGGGELGGVVADFTLEESWTHIVHSHSTMSRSQRHQQEAIWELIHTELSYIHKLTVVTDLVLAALTNLRQNGFLSEVTPELLFSNLPSILQAHHLFWQDIMLPMIQQVRETGKPFDPIKLESGCLQFSKLFSPYLQYCWEEERIVDFTRRQQITSPQFHTYLTWVESHPYVGRMRLGDMQAKPHQRITKYPLLLRAILKSSQDPVTQYSVRRMLTSVNSFLDSINEHLRFKDDELALSLAAQRVEGYEVTEGLNEEIDKHIREISCFDLTSPVQGLGPSDIRKLLMEETLKIKEKKDNKLEVVVLLFSDVLLVTKAQRKSEKLKVVRPPLALERTRCFTLKDGYSFVLVEVSDLGCAVSVYTIVAPSPESCSVWVSNIVKAQESLAARREAEMSHKLGEFRQTVAHIEKQALPPADKRDKAEQENQSETEDVLLSSLKLKDEASQSVSLNGLLPLPESKLANNNQNQLKNTHSLLLGRYSPSSQSARGHFLMGHRKEKSSGEEVKDVVMSEGSDQLESNEIIYPGIKERRVTWNHTNNTKMKTSSSNPNTHVITPADSTNIQSIAPVPSSLGKWQKLETSLHQSTPSSTSSLGEESIANALAQELTPNDFQKQGTLNPQDSDSQLSDQGQRRDSCISQSGDDFLTESWRFSRKLKSPRLKRRRPISAQNNPPQHVIRKGSLDSGEARLAFNKNSSSNSDSDCNQNLHRTICPSALKSDSYPTSVLSSSRTNQLQIWNRVTQRGSPEPQTLSEPEMPAQLLDQNSQKKPKFRAQRSVSIPDIIVQAGPDLLLTPGWSSAVSIFQSSPSQDGARSHTSSVEDILERARERTREREEVKAGKTAVRNFFLDFPPSPSLSTSPSPSPSEVDVDILGLHTSTIMGHKTKGGEEKEEGRGEESKTSFPLTDGASVDWPGWCFDDDEVLFSLVPEDRGGGAIGGDGGSRTLTLRDLRRISRQEDGEITEV